MIKFCMSGLFPLISLPLVFKLFKRCHMVHVAALFYDA